MFEKQVEFRNVLDEQKSILFFTAWNFLMAHFIEWQTLTGLMIETISKKIGFSRKEEENNSFLMENAIFWMFLRNALLKILSNTEL